MVFIGIPKIIINYFGFTKNFYYKKYKGKVRGLCK